jgi:hypothetical protein
VDVLRQSLPSQPSTFHSILSQLTHNELAPHSTDVAEDIIFPFMPLHRRPSHRPDQGIVQPSRAKKAVFSPSVRSCNADTLPNNCELHFTNFLH